MNRNNDIITSKQLHSLLITNVIGVGILSLPRTLAENAGPDSLIVLLIGGLLFLAVALLMQMIVKKFPQETIIDIGNSVLFKPLGTIIGLIYLAHVFIFTVLEVRLFGEITKNFLLINTPIEVLMISFLIVVVYVVRSGIESIARLSVIVLPIAGLPAIIASFASVLDLDFTYFLPIMRTPFKDIIGAVPQVFFSFLGYEFILFLAFFLKDTKNIKRSTFFSISFITVLYLISTAITIARFGIKETKNLVWPLVALFKSVDVPGTLLENVEVVIMSTWLLFVFMTVAIAYFATTFLLNRIIKSKEHNYLAIFLLPLVYIASLIPKNLVEVYDYLHMFVNYLGVTVAFIIPIFLSLVIFFRRKPKKGMKRNV